MTKTAEVDVSNFEPSNFVLVSDFEFRISDFNSYWLAFLLLLFVATACHSDSAGARGVAERFLDQHYVHIDIEAAKPFCTGLALQKLRDEQRLTQGQQIDESTRKPLVHYRLLETKDDAEHPSFVFQGTIDVEDAGQFTRKWLVTMRRDGDGWKVSNFEEFD